MAAGSHPVGGQGDVAEAVDGCRGDIHDGLGHRHAPGCRSVDERQGRALSHGHGFARIAPKAARGYGAIGHRHLPRPDHLVTHRQAAHRAIPDGDEKAFVGDAGQTQYPAYGVDDIEPAQVQRARPWRSAGDRAVHGRRIAQQQGHG